MRSAKHTVEVGRRAPSLAENVLFTVKAHDVVDGKKVALLAQVGEQCQLMLNLRTSLVSTGHDATSWLRVLARAGDGPEVCRHSSCG
jgi:hypothetical protein